MMKNWMKFLVWRLVQMIIWLSPFGREYFELDLPTEAQWEYACRAGTTTRWSCGPTAAHLEGYANVYDQTLLQELGRGDAVDFTDGHAFAAPVGSFAPNGFGLFDMHGNVAEWCRDLWVADILTRGTFRSGDGLCEYPVGYPKRPLRNGACVDKDREKLKSAYREPAPEDSRDERHGVRPSLPITGLVWQANSPHHPRRATVEVGKPD